MKLILILS